MPQPIQCHIAIAGNDPAFLNDWTPALNNCAKEHENRLNISFVCVDGMTQLENLAIDDGDLQGIIFDHQSLATPASELKQRFKDLRPEMDLYLITEYADQPIDTEFSKLFARNEKNLNRIFRVVQSCLAKRASAPFADTLREYIYSARDSWHTPGHSSGESLRDSPWVSDFYQLMGEHVFNADLSVSVQVLDSLQEPQSVIQEAQALAAETFGAQHTYFVTNGTSTANKVIVQHLLGGGGKILLDRGSHKSMHHAVILFGIEPVYLASSLQPDFALYGPVSQKDIFDAIDNHADAGLLVLTSCTYDGLYYDLPPIIERAHAVGIKVLIDEAWYAHGRFHPDLRPNALDSGADYVTHSTHKMLSAFSQASMIHVNDPDFDEYRFRENLNMHTSTSPQYAMIASLDVARKQMSMEGYKCLCECMRLIKRLRSDINATRAFQVLELEELIPSNLIDDNIRLDPTKLTIDTSKSGFTGKEIQLSLFKDFGIQIEKTTHNTITILVTLGVTESKAMYLIQALRQISENAKNTNQYHKPTTTRLPDFSEIKQLPRQAYFGKTELQPLNGSDHGVNANLVDCISADEIVPYPPGIPLLVPGQVITQDILDYLMKLISSSISTEVHGVIFKEEEPMLRISRAD